MRKSVWAIGLIIVAACGQAAPPAPVEVDATATTGAEVTPGSGQATAQSFAPDAATPGGTVSIGFEEDSLQQPPYPNAWADKEKGSSITLGLSDKERVSGKKALKVDFVHAPGSWGSGFFICPPEGWEKMAAIGGAKNVVCSVKNAKDMRIALSIRDEDDEEYRSGWVPITSNDWQIISVPLSDLKVCQYGGNQAGNKRLDANCRGIVVSLDGSAGPNKGTIYFDDMTVQ